MTNSNSSNTTALKVLMHIRTHTRSDHHTVHRWGEWGVRWMSGGGGGSGGCLPGDKIARPLRDGAGEA
jgi:hypothetical protein